MPHTCPTVTKKFPVNSNGEVDVQLSLFGLLLLTQPLNSSKQHTRADLEFSSDFGFYWSHLSSIEIGKPDGISQKKLHYFLL